MTIYEFARELPFALTLGAGGAWLFFLYLCGVAIVGGLVVVSRVCGRLGR